MPSRRAPGGRALPEPLPFPLRSAQNAAAPQRRRTHHAAIVEVPSHLTVSRPPHRGPARGHPRAHPRGAGEGRLRAERVPRARAPAGRVPRLLRLPRRADAQGGRADQGRAGDDRRRDQRRPTSASTASWRTARSCASTRRSRCVADQVAVNYRKADITPRQQAMLDFAMKVACARGEIGDADFARAARARLQRRGRLGHRRHRRVLRAVEPDGQLRSDAAERRVLPDGAGAAAEAGLNGGDTTHVFLSCACGSEHAGEGRK